MANGTTYAWLLAVLALLLGGLIGALVFPDEKIVTETELKIVEVPVPISETVIEADTNPSDRATVALLKEIDENEALWECGRDDYDPSEISVMRVRETEVYKKYTDDSGEYTVVLDARLKYEQGDDVCYDNVDVEVTYDNDREEPIVDVN